MARDRRNSRQIREEWSAEDRTPVDSQSQFTCGHHYMQVERTTRTETRVDALEDRATSASGRIDKIDARINKLLGTSLATLIVALGALAMRLFGH